MDGDGLELFREFVVKHARASGIIDDQAVWTTICRCEFRGNIIFLSVKRDDGTYNRYEYRFKLARPVYSEAKELPKGKTVDRNAHELHLPIGLFNLDLTKV